MANVVFPTTSAIANTIPTNGNTVPIEGTQAITNHAEGLAYFGLAYANCNESEEINFGGIVGVLPMASVNTVETSKGVKFLEIVARIPLNSDYAMFPDGKKLHKQVFERLPNEAATSAFNF
ncbi:hypothetical protein HCU40_16765 [Pseudanabaena biceps]|nr:hypothetical protein [Pseudanabaena biceps]